MSLQLHSVLRQKGFDNFREWTRNPTSLYVGRAGRIFIAVPEGNVVYHYAGSVWANPFVLAKDGKTSIVITPSGAESVRKSRYSLVDSLVRYENHIRVTLWDNLHELDGKVLGCFCKQGVVERCHAQVLVRLWREKRGM